MAEFEIIDAHLHTYPTAEIGLQAMDGRGRAGYTGTIDELLGVMKDGGISKSVMLNLTPQPDMREAALARLPEAERERARTEINEKIIARTIRRNQWTCDVAREHPELIPCINLDLEMTAERMREEILDKVKNHGAKGIKMQPANQRFFPADEPVQTVYQTALELGIPVFCHAGKFQNAPDYARPAKFADVLAQYSNLTFILAHIGHGYEEECVELAASYPNVSFDLSACISGSEAPDTMGDEEAVALLRKIGVEKIMFGTDYPWYDPIRDSQRIISMPLTDDEKRLILSENAKRILKI